MVEGKAEKRRVQGFEGSERKGFKDSRIRRSEGFKDSRIQGFKWRKTEGWKVGKGEGFKESRIQGFKWFAWHFFQNIKAKGLRISQPEKPEKLKKPCLIL